MPIWKEITVEDLTNNQNDLDMRKMYKAGAIQSEQSYPALEIDRNAVNVTVLARLEVGFEEYVVFSKEYYDNIPATDYQYV